MTQQNCIYCYRKIRKKNYSIKKNSEKIKLVLFDMDGVLTDTVSSWKYIHDYFNTSNERSVKEYLKGKIDDMEFIRRDASLWIENNKPIKKEKLSEILSNVPIMKGAKECISFLKENNIKTAIVSAGLDVLANRVGKKLAIDYIYSNGIKTDKNGRLTGVGIIGVKLMYKDLTVKKISKDLNIPFNSIASVGNSCFDIPMFEYSGLSIAFDPQDNCTKNKADIIINEKDLSKIIPYLKQYIS